MHTVPQTSKPNLNLPNPAVACLCETRHQQAPPCQNSPHHTWPNRAEPSLARPRPTIPRRLFSPCRSRPHQTTPCLPKPDPARPHRTKASPTLQWQTLPDPTRPLTAYANLTPSGRVEPFPPTPEHALPNLAYARRSKSRPVRVDQNQSANTSNLVTLNRPNDGRKSASPMMRPACCSN